MELNMSCEIESIQILIHYHVGEMARKPPFYVREILIDLATAQSAHGFAFGYFRLPMGGQGV
jgi:hypothetical protein